MESQVAKNTSQIWLSGSPLIRQLLLSRLQAVIKVYGETLNPWKSEAASLELLQVPIPLYRVQDDTRVLYKSAIALKLASLCDLPSFEISHQLMTYLGNSPDNYAEQSLLEFTVTLLSPGWLSFQLTNQSLAAWLQFLLETPLSQEDLAFKEIYQPPSMAHLDLFPIQYAHARCCSLLRLAHQQGLIQLSPHPQNRVGQIIQPNPIPWLNLERGELQLVHPAEQRLISQILALLDEVTSSSLLTQESDKNVSLVKLVRALSDALLNFYSQCRIWGEVKTETLLLAQARLGLVSLTQSILALILKERLGVYAPLEL